MYQIIRIRNEKRTRIRLGGWPAIALSETRHAVLAGWLEVVSGGDLNEEKRKAIKEAAIAAKGRRRLAKGIVQSRRDARFLPFAATLFNDRTAVLPISREDRLKSQTDAIAMHAGRRWRIPLTAT